MMEVFRYVYVIAPCLYLAGLIAIGFARRPKVFTAALIVAGGSILLLFIQPEKITLGEWLLYTYVRIAAIPAALLLMVVAWAKGIAISLNSRAIPDYNDPLAGRHFPNPVADASLRPLFPPHLGRE